MRIDEIMQTSVDEQLKSKVVKFIRELPRQGWKASSYDDDSGVWDIEVNLIDENGLDSDELERHFYGSFNENRWAEKNNVYLEVLRAANDYALFRVQTQ